MKRIWIINHYAGETYVDHGGRHYWLAKYLGRLGYEPVIICSNTYHGKQGTFVDVSGKWNSAYDDEIKTLFVFIKTRTYSGNGKQRLLNILDFYVNLLLSYKRIIQKFGKPDIVFASSIHPLAPVAGIKIAKRMGIPCICEYRDLWPDELICMGAISETGIIARLLRLVEHWSYKRADSLVFTMEGAVQYIKDRKWDIDNGGDIDLQKAYYINNGVDIESYLANQTKYRLEDEDLESEKFKVVYTGTMNYANGVQRVFDIAKELADCADVVFFLYGAGNEVEAIKKRIQDEHIQNIVYKGSVNKRFIPYILSKSNLNLLNYLTGDLFRYGCSNNKLFEYIASGNPILCTISMNYSILQKFGCGIEVEDGDPVKIAGIIKNMIYHPEKVDVYKKNCTKAIGYFNFEKHALQLDRIISGLIEVR